MCVRYLETLNTSTVSISCRAAQWGFFGGKPVEAQCAGAQFHTPSSSCQPWGGLGGRTGRGPSAGPPPQLPHITNLFPAGEAFREIGKSRGRWLLCATVLPAPARCRPGPRLCLAEVSTPSRLPRSPHFLPPSDRQHPRSGGASRARGEGKRLPRMRVAAPRFLRALTPNYFSPTSPIASRRGNCRSSGGAQRACAGHPPPDTHVLPRGGRAVPAGQDIPLTDTTHRLLFGVWTPEVACFSSSAPRCLPNAALLRPGAQSFPGEGGATRSHAGGSVT